MDNKTRLYKCLKWRGTFYKVGKIYLVKNGIVLNPEPILMETLKSGLTPAVVIYNDEFRSFEELPLTKLSKLLYD